MFSLLVIAICTGAVSERVTEGAAYRYRGASLISPSRSETCSAHRAVRFYSARVHHWTHKMGAAHVSPIGRRLSGSGCPRYLAKVLRAKAYAARHAYERWFAYHHDWRSWLPAKWYRIARCETGVRWDWNSGPYQGAFGFAVSSWDAFRLEGYPSEAYLATPRQQYEVALSIWRRYGFSGWGCRNA